MSAMGIKKVVRCYDLLDLCRLCGITHLTEGIWAHPDISYEDAQQAQTDYLLSELQCERGDHILDIGCGYGRLLDSARVLGLVPQGITVSAPQVLYCRRRGLAVRLLDYRLIGTDWTGLFGGIVANGSLEHFVAVEEAAQGRQDRIYRNMFDLCRRITTGPGRRMVTTAIHFRRQHQFDPADIMSGTTGRRRGSDKYHYAALCCFFGGWYPYPGQLAQCAAGRWRLVKEVDGTLDYCLTSEFWLKRIRARLAVDPRVGLGLMLWLMRHWRAALGLLRCILIDQSWLWQFRGDPPPMVLYRHTWEAV